VTGSGRGRWGNGLSQPQARLYQKLFSYMIITQMS
jgi:hypothetical protein